MTQIEWSNEAVTHLAQIHSFIAADSPHYAEKFILELMNAVDHLASFPEVGRQLPDVADPSVRELVVAPYRVVYQVGGSVISIAAVVHSSRDLNSIENKPWDRE